MKIMALQPRRLPELGKNRWRFGFGGESVHPVVAV